MADIASSTVFTNGVSCGTSDLLRQAFQEVVDDEDRENEFVAFLQGDGDESHPIHLTHAQASALRLTFEVDPVDERDNDITYNHDENAILGDIRTGAVGLDNEETTPTPNDSLDALNFPTAEMNDAASSECSQLREWAAQESSPDEPMETDSAPAEGSEQGASLLHRFADGRDVRQIYLRQNSGRPVESNGATTDDGEIQFATGETVATNFQRNNAQRRASQAQILQRLPVLLPSSQFVIKPAPALLKTAKNVRILPSTTKIGSWSAINANTGQNSILLPKSMLEALSPQIIKANPVTTQLINGGGVSAQLMDASQILRTNCDFQQRNGNANGARVGRGSINAPIRLSPAVKTSAGMIQTSDGQQFVIPTLKTSHDGTVVKTLQLSNGNSGKTAISGQFFKSVQIPAQMLRNASTTFLKTMPVSSSPKTGATTSAPIMFRNEKFSVLKTPDSKTATTMASSISRNSGQINSTPISILKPQSKSAIAVGNRQNLIIDGQNVVASSQNPRFVQKTSNGQTNDANERLRMVQNVSKPKPSENAVDTARIVKKAKIAGLHNPVALTAEQTDTTKPLGSSENPIQIVQQGHTFHSMQRLTQSQLKQIAHVLQQRSQEAAMPNERIVYRVVFPEELDLRMRNPGSLVKARGGKRGRPKKTAARPAAPLAKTPAVADEEHEEAKDDRKKVVARTRSGRLSRPPRHMVRDYKHLHHLDFTQPDLDDSDGGYSDYNTNPEKIETDGSPKELLTGLEVPKRKISDHFRCPTCSKIYLGRTRMARHFEMHPDHGSPEQLPPPTPDPELKRAISQDPLKRKGKKRGPWAYVTPEAKSERRQVKLKEAISVCENIEIINIAAKPVLDAQSIFDLLILKSDGNVRNFLNELKVLVDKVREHVGTMISVAVDSDGDTADFVELASEESLCDVLAVQPGVYKINNEAFRKPDESFSTDADPSVTGEPPLKLQKTHITDDSKEILDERMSSGFSESSDMSVSDFLHERKNEATNANCPEVLTALTLMPRNPSPVDATDNEKTNNVSKLLISNPEIQHQISENRGFQKIDINSSKCYRKLESLKDGFAKLTESLELTNCSTDFTKLNDNYEQPKMHGMQQAFVKLEPMEQGFKLENSTMSVYEKDDSQDFENVENGYENMETGSTSFVKGFHKLISKIVPINDNEKFSKNEISTNNVDDEKLLRSDCKNSDGLTILQDNVTIMSNSCDGSIFGSTDNLDIGKITGYDHIPHLDILTTSGVIDKHLMMDEKLVEQMNLVDQTNLVDELVSERLKNIMPDNILENNLMPNGSNIDADLDFEALSEEFNRNTRS